MAAAFTARGLVKRYGPVTALHGVDLDVEEGELVGLLGPNGAGKSTLVKIGCGLVRATAGEATIPGRAAAVELADASAAKVGSGTSAAHRTSRRILLHPRCDRVDLTVTDCSFTRGVNRKPSAAVCKTRGLVSGGRVYKKRPPAGTNR